MRKESQNTVRKFSENFRCTRPYRSMRLVGVDGGGGGDGGFGGGIDKPSDKRIGHHPLARGTKITPAR